jgi:cysteine desulfurase
VDGECTWLLLDAESRSCIVIDALAPLAGRIADFIRCQQYAVRAVIDTGAHQEAGSGRDALLALLEGHADGAAGGSPLGWPVRSESISLGDGMPVDALVLGRRVLARLAREDGGFDSATYLLGARSDERVLAGRDVAYAFTGAAVSARLAALTGPQTILCALRESGGVPCTTLAARAITTLSTASTHQLDAQQLEQFMSAHPDAVLVDVREAYEHAAARGGAWQGRKAHSVPLSRLADCLPGWLKGEHKPLVFFCRSGGRSARAVECLQRLGYRNAWHVSGALPQESARRRDSVAA